MSLEKYQHDARRWLQQAQADLGAARNSLVAGSYEWASFQSQQAGEKASKSFWLSRQFDPWGHSLVTLVQDFPDPDLRSRLMPIVAEAKALDKLYIPTRYPNGLPDLTPAEVYTDADARQAIQAAERIIGLVRELANPKPPSNDQETGESPK